MTEINWWTDYEHPADYRQIVHDFTEKYIAPKSIEKYAQIHNETYKHLIGELIRLRHEILRN